MQGHVYDKGTKLPLEHVKVMMILGNKDTIKHETVYDTVSNSERIALREKGVKDNYDWHNASGWYKTVPSFLYTDHQGYFSISSGLLGCPFGCPDAHLAVTKEGYKLLLVTNDSMKLDSILLERNTQP